MIHEKFFHLVLPLLRLIGCARHSFIIFIVVVCFLPSLSLVAAQTLTPTPNNTIQKLQEKVSELQGQANSLSKQIGILDSDISITQLRVQS
jgi:cell division protein FtsL